MKLVTYQYESRTAVGAVVADVVVDLSNVAADMLSLIEMGSEGLTRARSAIETADVSVPLGAVRLMAPIPTPRRNVFCLGLNYAEHVEESSAAKGLRTELPEFPVVFTKVTTSVNGPFDDIPFDPAVSEQIDWEAELGVVVGQSGKNIAVADAMAHVFGYTVVNDISARDLQWRHKQFFKGKSLDGACPVGPWIVTADEVSDPHNLRIAARVNGVTKQDSSTQYMIFDVPTTISQLSNGMTLLPGDLIATGTPSGVGFARQPPEFLRPGDVVECEVEGIGTIRNRVGTPS